MIPATALAIVARDQLGVLQKMVPDRQRERDSHPYGPQPAVAELRQLGGGDRRGMVVPPSISAMMITANGMALTSVLYRADIYVRIQELRVLRRHDDVGVRGKMQSGPRHEPIHRI
jgi:hypothetical protein